MFQKKSLIKNSFIFPTLFILILATVGHSWADDLLVISHRNDVNKKIAVYTEDGDQLFSYAPQGDFDENIPTWIVAKKRLGSRANRATAGPAPPASSMRRSWPSRSEMSAISVPENRAFTSTSTATSASSNHGVVIRSSEAHTPGLARVPLLRVYDGSSFER